MLHCMYVSKLAHVGMCSQQKHSKQNLANRAIMCAKQLKEHVKQVKKLVQVHTVVLCVGPFLCRFSIDRDGVFTC